MEFVPYPNLAEIFLFRNIGPNAWIRIITSIKKVYKSFYGETNYKVVKNASWLYSSKLNSTGEHKFSKSSSHLSKFITFDLKLAIIMILIQ